MGLAKSKRPIAAPGFIGDGSQLTGLAAAALAANSVALAKLKMTVSAEQTGTGASQNVAHFLGVAPLAVFVSPTNVAGGTAFVVTEGAHDGTNVKLTVTSADKFKVIAFA
jgi:hypothetical protein